MSRITRRGFLKAAGSAAGALALQNLFRPSLLLAQSAQAGSDKNIVIVNLLGGLDGLSAFPYYEGPIAELINTTLRPTLFIPPGEVIPLVAQSGELNKIGLNPEFRPLVEVAGARMKIIQSYGIPGDPGRSHDTCQILMSMGATRLRGISGDMTGFMARLMDQQNWDTLQYWSLATTNNPDINARKKPPVQVSDLSSLDYPQLVWEASADRDLAVEIQKSLLEVRKPRPDFGDKFSSALSVMHDTVAVVRRDIGGQEVGRYSDDGIGSNLRDAAKILKAKVNAPALGLRGKDMLILTAQGGYDTHSDQFNPASGVPNLSRTLGNLAGNLTEFYRDLARFGILDKTIIILYSEFGRTSYQNGGEGMSTAGTDHGHASSTVVFGGPVRAGVIGEAPAEQELRNTDYNAQIPKIDYRDIFSDALRWLGANPRQIFDDPAYNPQSLGLFT